MPSYFDTVIVGSGPSALILSYILSGHEPVICPSASHPDPQLQAKLSKVDSLFGADLQHLTSHFQASRLSYSTQALPYNVLLDTLLRPLGDTEPGLHESCIEWRNTGRRVPHLILGSTHEPGGQWQENPVKASWGIGALSYAELLSLPGYSIEEHLKKRGQEVCHFLRPERRVIADYLRVYPGVVGIEDNIRNSNGVTDVRRADGGFYIGSHDIRCRHLVLASGTFSRLIPARPQLQPLLRLPEKTLAVEELPLLIVGSGFSAADLIITHLPKRKIIHIFKWDPIDCVSPLRACHPQAYPEYSAVYRRMKVAAKHALGDNWVASPMPRQKSNAFFNQTQIDLNYEGLPNTWIEEAAVEDGYGRVVLKLSNGQTVERKVAGLQYVIGRRGSLEYLSPELQEETLGASAKADLVSGRTLRSKVEEGVEIAPNVFTIGSLDGDSLIRHAYGSCVLAAGTITRRQSILDDNVKMTNSQFPTTNIEPSQEYVATNGHENLGFWKQARRRLSSQAEDLDYTKKKRASLVSECVLV